MAVEPRASQTFLIFDQAAAVEVGGRVSPTSDGAAGPGYMLKERMNRAVQLIVSGFL